MNKVMGIVANIHWRFVLPVLMTVITACLLVASAIQLSRPRQGFPVPWPTAHVVAALVGGPAFYPFLRIPLKPIEFDDALFDVAPLPGTAMFWFCLGVLLEWKLNGVEWLIRKRTARIAIFSVPTMVLVLLLFSQLNWLNSQGSLPWQSVFHTRSEWILYPQILWTALGIGYFGTKVWTAAVRRR